MNLELPDEIVAFAKSARRALADTPALDRVRAAMNGDTDARRGVLDIVSALGIDDLGADTHVGALGAAHLAYEVGRVGGLVPVAALVTAGATGRDGLVQSAGSSRGRLLVNHADLAAPAAVVSIDGSIRGVTIEVDASHRHLLAPFAAAGTTGLVEAEPEPWFWALYETLDTFASLGAVDGAIDSSRAHLLERHQFGRPLASFQALQHRFADMLLAATGLSELAHYTLWKLYDSPGQAVNDSLALRSYRLETVQSVFRHAHQIHAAIGLCDEHPLSLLSRSVRFGQYVPLTIDETLAELGDRLADGFDAIFPIGTLGN